MEVSSGHDILYPGTQQLCLHKTHTRASQLTFQDGVGRAQGILPQLQSCGKLMALGGGESVGSWWTGHAPVDGLAQECEVSTLDLVCYLKQKQNTKYSVGRG